MQRLTLSYPRSKILKRNVEIFWDTRGRPGGEVQRVHVLHGEKSDLHAVAIGVGRVKCTPHVACEGFFARCKGQHGGSYEKGWHRSLGSSRVAPNPAFTFREYIYHCDSLNDFI